MTQTIEFGAERWAGCKVLKSSGRVEAPNNVFTLEFQAKKVCREACLFYALCGPTIAINGRQVSIASTQEKIGGDDCIIAQKGVDLD